MHMIKHQRMVCCSWRRLCPLAASLNVHIVLISRALLPCLESVHAAWLLYCKDSSSLDSVHLNRQMASAIPAQLFNSWLVSCNACRLTACHLQAARYQIMIMFLIAATTCIAVVGSVYLAVLNILDRQHRLCSEKILPRAATGSGVEHWIQGQTVRVSVYTLQAKQDFILAWGVAFSIKSGDKQFRLRMAKRHQDCTKNAQGFMTVTATPSCCILRDRQPNVCQVHACMFWLHWYSCVTIG